MRTALRFVVIAAGAICALVVTLYVATSGVPELKSPVKVVDASFVADGGSFHIVIRDADATEFAIGASGSLGKARVEFPIYTQRWWPYMPVPSFVVRGGATEDDLQRAVLTWLHDTRDDEPAQVALRPLAALLQERAASKPTR